MNQHEVSRFTVSASDAHYFHENGFWKSDSIFDKHELGELRNHYYRILDGHYETGVSPLKRSTSSEEIGSTLVKITNCIWSDSTYSKIALSPRIGFIASQLLAEPCIRYWRDHLWYKPPNVGIEGHVGWHQDHYYWQCAEPATFITAWIAIEDVPEEAGCLEYVAGSHHLGLLESSNLYDKDVVGTLQNFQEEVGQELRTVKCPLKAGEVLFHHSLVLHASQKNIGPSPRLSISVHMFPEGTVYRKNRSVKPFSNEKLFSGSDGELFRGPYFPVIYRNNGSANPWEIES